MNVTIKTILRELRKELRKLYGDNLVKLMVFGSWARGEAYEDSDVDVVVVLRDMDSQGKEIDRMIDIIYELNLRHNTLISVYPVSEVSFAQLKSPLLMNIRKEGVEV